MRKIVQEEIDQAIVIIKKSVEEKLGKTFKLGTVIVKGLPKEYTEITTDPVNVKFSDADFLIFICSLEYKKYRMYLELSSAII